MAFPRFSLASFTALGEEIFVNALVTGAAVRASPVYKEALPGSGPPAPELEVENLGDRWLRISVPGEVRDLLEGIVVSGGRGALRIELVERAEAGGAESPFAPLGELVVEQGRLRATLMTDPPRITNPLGMGIEVFDPEGERFIEGSVVAVSGREIAVEFEGLPHRVISEDGNLRLSIITPDGNYINSTISAWGYYLEVPDADIGNASQIRASVYGLSKKELLSFTFTPLSGQQIAPQEATLSVEEINSGKPIASVETTVPGAQPLSVEVKRVGSK